MVLPSSSQYQTLAATGLKLPEIEFNTILLEVEKGILEAKEHLKTTDTGPQVTFSNDISAIGFSAEHDSINIRIDYLNLFASNHTPLDYKDQLVCFVPNKFYVIVKYLTWLRLFGREETIHYYQYHSNPHLKIKFPEKFPELFSPKSLLLSDLEIEARTIGDSIALANNDNPIWKNIDEYLAANFPEFYNKPIEHLATLPKPNLQMSFEMENILI